MQNAEENALDVKSPYIKTYNKNLDEIRAALAERKSVMRSISSQIQNQKINLSDIDKKIDNVTRKVVGSEIRKFAEVMGKEMETELQNFEERVTEDINQKISSLETGLLETVLASNEATEEEINMFAAKFAEKLELFNKIILELTQRLEDLEIYSMKNLEEIKDALSSESILVPLNKSNGDDRVSDQDVMMITEEIVGEEEDTEEEFDLAPLTDLAAETLVPVTNLETESEQVTLQIDNDLAEDIDEETYIQNKLKDIISIFDTEGFLFRKNSYNAHLKNASAVALLENFDEYRDLDINVRLKISDIVMGLIKTLGLSVAEEETVHQFLERALSQEYKVKRKSFLQKKLANLEKLITR